MKQLRVADVSGLIGQDSFGIPGRSCHRNRPGGGLRAPGHPEPARADIFDLARWEMTIGRLYIAALLQPYSGLAKTGWALERHPGAR